MTREIKEQIKKILREATKQYLQDTDKKFGDFELKIFATDNYDFGDYTTNIAMILAKPLGKSPQEIAKGIVEKISETEFNEVKKIEVAPSGYVNFYLSDSFFFESVLKIIREGKKWGSDTQNDIENKKYLFEHSSPNLFKPFHIGHLVNNSIGESLVRMLKFSGAKVTVVSFPSDISPGIAKTIWAIREMGMEKDINIRNIGKAYAYGVKKYKESEEARKEIDEINKKLYLEEKFFGLNIYEKGKEISLAYFKEIMEKLGSRFDALIFETEAEKVGKKIVAENEAGIFEKSEGAIIFPGSKYGLFDNVFVNSAGFGTYLAKDLGLLKIKFEKFNFDKSVTITDVEQREHFQLVKKVAELINKDWAEKSDFVQHGRLRFAGKKISSRYGNVPLAEDLIEEVKKRVLEKMSEQNIKLQKMDEIAEMIAIGALKYSILKSNAGKNIVFDFKKSISFDGDSGPYLQYTFVRTVSILKRAGTDLKEIDFAEYSGRDVVFDVEKKLLKFPEAIRQSIEDYSPHHLVNYLHKLASDFNSFYGKVKVLDKDNDAYLQNLALVKAVNITLKNGMNLLGIKTVDEM